MAAAVKVRHATAKDLPALATMAQAFGTEQVESSGWGRLGEQFEQLVRETLDMAIKNPYGLVLLAEVGDQPVAYLMAQVAEPPPLFEPDSYLFVSDLWVYPDWRQKGVGAELLEQARMWGLTKGLERISMVALEGSGGVQLGRRLGFRTMQHLMVWQYSEQGKE